MIRCEHCGSMLPDGAIFCGECGRSVNVSANRRPAPAAPADDTPPPPLRQPDQYGRRPDPAAEAWLPEATLDPATRAWLTGEDRQRPTGPVSDRPAAPPAAGARLLRVPSLLRVPGPLTVLPRLPVIRSLPPTGPGLPGPRRRGPRQPTFVWVHRRRNRPSTPTLTRRPRTGVHRLTRTARPSTSRRPITKGRVTTPPTPNAPVSRRAPRRLRWPPSRPRPRCGPRPSRSSRRRRRRPRRDRPGGSAVGLLPPSRRSRTSTMHRRPTSSPVPVTPRWSSH